MSSHILFREIIITFKYIINQWEIRYDLCLMINTHLPYNGRAEWD